MLSAYNQHEDDVVAWEVTREQGPFFCPECKEPVVVKKGQFKVHHFAHRPDSDCAYGVGESEQHRQAKYQIYEALLQHPSVGNLKVERNLKDIRPDISFCWQGRDRVGIELQISAIALDEVERRTRSYLAKDMSVLWIMPYHSGVSGLRPYRTKIRERYLHALYFGRVFYWLSQEKLVPVHFEPYSLGWVSREEYDEDAQEFSWNEFERFSPSLRNPEPGEVVRISELQTIWRSFRRIGPFTLPRAKLWSLPAGR